MLGQIATFMEELHMSYREILSMPYRTLVVMQRDKLHEVEEVMEEVSEEEFFKNKKK